ncbi:hypothetical protein AS593_00340 [Caulobacter vibrioides]|nr:hypothetical protein AS593_00340 [Caulobacter vibrioides]
MSNPIKRGLTPLDGASILTTASIAGAALAVWRLGPSGPMPMHFNVAGQVDRWGDRAEMAAAIGVIALVAGGVAGLCAVMERQVRDPLAERFTYRLGRIVGLAAPAFAAAMLTFVAFGLLPRDGGQEAFLRLMMGGMSLLFLGLGAFLGRVKPNPIVGVRTYWALRSRLAWDKSNRLAGRLMTLVGLAGLVTAPAVPQPVGFHVLMGALIASGLAAGFESWRVWRTDPDRT